MSVIVYPHLYTSRLSEGDDVLVSQGDQSVDLLYALYHERGSNTRSWPFRRNILINALRLFGDLQDWAREQLMNPNILGYNRGFVQDTIKFMETGKRELSVESWSDLITSGGPSYSVNAVPQCLLNNKPLMASSDASLELLQKWVSQPGGLEDLLVTLHLFFGKASNL